jgi:virginiamycin A acetyltransferase
MREAAKAFARFVADVAAAPAVFSYRLRSLVLGPHRALEGSSQALALMPGIVGQYVRRAFLRRVLAYCDRTATIEFGAIFSDARARIEARAYVGPRCALGYVHLGRDVLLGPAVCIPSGPGTHGTASLTEPIREQAGTKQLVRIGDGSWVGSAAVVMADVGRDSVVGAGAVVTHPVPDAVIVGGVPARVLRSRNAARPIAV